MTIYARVYDCDTNPDGTKRPNKILGRFRILKTVREDMYSGLCYGVRGGKLYRIESFEVCGVGGGMRNVVTPVLDSDDVQVWIEFNRSNEVAK